MIVQIHLVLSNRKSISSLHNWRADNPAKVRCNHFKRPNIRCQWLLDNREAGVLFSKIRCTAECQIACTAAEWWTQAVTGVAELTADRHFKKYILTNYFHRWHTSSDEFLIAVEALLLKCQKRKDLANSLSRKVFFYFSFDDSGKPSLLVI